MPRSPRWRRALPCAAVTMLALALAPAAFASTASISGATIDYVGGLGAETNFVTFSISGANVRITEGVGGVNITAGAGCAQFAVNIVDCPSAGITAISGDAGDGQDSFTNQTTITGTFLGGPGDDTYFPASTASDSFDGGPGVFTGVTSTGDGANYSNAANGITATLVNGSTTITTAGFGTKTFTNIEVLDGSSNATTGDSLTGDGNDNQLIGFGGDDTFSAGGGNDDIQGGTGNDTMDGGPGSDTLQDSSTPGSHDVATYANEPAGVTVFPITVPAVGFQVNTSSGTDGVYQGIEDITGSPQPDSITGDGLPNLINGGGGNDTIDGGGGNDTLDGGAGTGDTASWSSSAAAVTASILGGSATSGADTDTLTNFENLSGSSFGDTLIGNASANTLTGLGGSDTVDYSGEAAGVNVNLAAAFPNASGASIGSDSLATIENVIGSPFADAINIRDAVTGGVDCGAGADTAVTDAADTAQPSCETVAPVATATPTISGGSTVGDQLTVTNGSWAGGPGTFAYQWRQCDSNGASCVAIPGATSTTYTTTAADVGHRLRAAVTSSNAAGSDTRTTGITAVIQQPPSSSAPASSSSSTSGPVASSSALPDPIFTRTVNAELISGSVLVEEPGQTSFAPLTGPTQLKFGTIVDARHGRVRLTTIDAKGRKYTADFFEGEFKLFQQRAAGGITELDLYGGNFKACKAKKAGGAATASRKRGSSKSIRHLWGSGKGLFRTKGRYAAATIRGTTWLTDDRCDGTLVRVKKGAVTVRDFPKKKTLILKAPKRYLALPTR